jgi:hypothetical protein
MVLSEGQSESPGFPIEAFGNDEFLEVKLRKIHPKRLEEIL